MTDNDDAEDAEIEARIEPLQAQVDAEMDRARNADHCLPKRHARVPTGPGASRKPTETQRHKI